MPAPTRLTKDGTCYLCPTYTTKKDPDYCFSHMVKYHAARKTNRRSRISSLQQGRTP